MNKDTIFICGNGLDLAHSLKTSYLDFKNYCEKHRPYFYQNLSSALELKSGNNSLKDLWSSLEKSLGEISVDKLITKSTEHLSLSDYKEIKRTKNGYEIIPHEESKLIQLQASGYMRILRDLRNELKEYLKNHISLNNAHCIELISNILDSTSKVISFNYTETLEKLYTFQAKDILHIHGNINSEIIIGHGNSNYYVPNPTVNEQDPPLETVKNLHLLYLTETYKDTQQIYRNNINFFKTITQINHIVIYGHSMAELDDYYFKMIKNQFPDADWDIYIKNDKDKESAILFKGRIGLAEGTYKLIRLYE